MTIFAYIYKKWVVKLKVKKSETKYNLKRRQTPYPIYPPPAIACAFPQLRQHVAKPPCRWDASSGLRVITTGRHIHIWHEPRCPMTEKTSHWKKKHMVKRQPSFNTVWPVRHEQFNLINLLFFLWILSFIIVQTSKRCRARIEFS